MLAGERLVVTLGLRDTVVVDTPDALLVCAADRSQESGRSPRSSPGPGSVPLRRRTSGERPSRRGRRPTDGTPGAAPGPGLSPAPPAPATIVFGTDGWRARVGEDFTFDAVRRCAEGVVRYVVDRGEQAKGVVVAYDRRFASEHFAAAAAEVLLAHEIPIAFAAHAVPTQMASYEVVQRGSAAGIVITASHNPWTDNGFKVKSPSGAAAGPDILAALEAVIAGNGGRAIPRRPLADAEAAGLVERFDPYVGYERFVRRTLDLDALRAAEMRVLVDPMWGSGAGWISRLLAGGRIEVVEIHTERNPYFGGVNPEPIQPNVDEALGLVAGGGFDLGLLLDGDADRSGAVDERGVFVHQLQVYGLLMYYLAEHRGLRAPVVKTVNETAMAERLGAHYGIDVHETPVGFKYVGPKMIETGAMFGGRSPAATASGCTSPSATASTPTCCCSTSSSASAPPGGGPCRPRSPTSTRSPGPRSTSASTFTSTGPPIRR